jgi:hypothetical protein
MTLNDFVYIQPSGHMFAATLTDAGRELTSAEGRPVARVTDPKFSTVEAALFWALERRTAFGPIVDPGCNWNPLAPTPVGETPDPPEAPVWLNAEEAESWQSGWVRGFTDADGVVMRDQIAEIVQMIDAAAVDAGDMCVGLVAEALADLAAAVRARFPQIS